MDKIFALRGATTIEKDTIEEVKEKSLELFEKIVGDNDLKKEDIISLTSTMTADITSAYPVKFVRENGSMSDIVLFSALEPSINGALKLCIRYMLHVQKSDEFVPKHIYLHGAVNLRKDLIK